MCGGGWLRDGMSREAGFSAALLTKSVSSSGRNDRSLDRESVWNRLERGRACRTSRAVVIRLISLPALFRGPPFVLVPHLMACEYRPMTRMTKLRIKTWTAGVLTIFFGLAALRIPPNHLIGFTASPCMLFLSVLSAGCWGAFLRVGRQADRANKLKLNHYRF